MTGYYLDQQVCRVRDFRLPGFKIYMHVGYALRAHIHDANKRGSQSHIAKTKVLYLKCATGQIVLSITIQRCCLANNASK